MTGKKFKQSSVIFIAAIMIILWGNPSNSYSGGLKTSFAEVLLENLHIGKSYNIGKIANFPIEVFNTSPKRIQLTIKPVMPDKVKSGFEPIPDLGWITLSKTDFILDPDGSAKSDIIITIPDNKKYLGGKYEVNILSSGSKLGRKGMFGFEAALRSRLLFTVYKDKIDDTGVLDKQVNLNFDVLPLKSVVSNIITGVRTDLAEKGVILSIRNNNTDSFEYEIESLPIKDTVSSIPDDYIPCPDPQLLSFSDVNIKVGPKQTKYVKMYLDFPDKDDYRNKKYMFIVSMRVRNKSITGNRYIRVYVQTD
ncbi:MAG: hypothetical protein KKH98_08925 [Spirochaetes bacterium]|nr:hypothetical protein [Spirochaetota bacterium]